MRSCEPRVVRWRLIASFARVIAVDLIRDGGIHGRMVGIVDGKYAHVPIPEPGSPRKVDVDTMYDPHRFRPQYHNRLGRPLLLGASVSAGVGDPVLA